MINYVPILKGKSGELAALQRLARRPANHLVPFIDVPRIPLNWNGGTKVSIDKHLGKVASNIITTFDANRPFFLDLYDLDLSERMKNGAHPLSFLAATVNGSGHKMTPTTGLERDAAYNAAISAANIDHDNGICVRLLREDIELRHLTYPGIDDLLEAIEVNKNDVVILLDLRSVRAEDVKSSVTVIKQFINNLPDVTSYRAILLASSGLPESMVSIPGNSCSRIARVELEIWRRVVNGAIKLARRPVFSDYGVVHPDTPDIDPRTMNASAKIRYTLANEWLIWKGKGLRTHPRRYKQFHDLSHKLAAEPDFLGPGFSWGDQYVAECATGNGKTGNLTTWVSVDTNHHLTFVSGQMAKHASRGVL